MKNRIKISLLLLVTIGFNLQAEENQDINKPRKRIDSVRTAISNVTKPKVKELDVVDGVRHMFEDGVVSGEIRTIYSEYNYDDSQNIYATALGGQLKYELAEYNGFNAAVAFTTSHEVSLLSGNDTKFNEELTSADGSYTELSEIYLNYKYENFNIRLGRQLIDTPLADSDDIRMNPNTFEAYILSYENNNFTFMGGLLNSFQGYDSGLDTSNHWQDTGTDGTYFSGISYDDDSLEASFWYYDISKDENPNSTMGNNANKSIYLSLGGNYHFSDTNFLHLVSQYLNQKEESNSGVESRIYGLVSELVIDNIGLNIAYNHSSKQKNKRSFSGFGGGTLFTSMDNMILDNIADDRDVDAVVLGLSYAAMKDLNLLYAYGDFDGDKNSAGVSEHIVEQNIGLEYTLNENITFASIYTKQDDKDNTGINGGDWDNFRVFASYSF